MSRYFTVFLLYIFSCMVDAESKEKWEYIEIQTGDLVIINPVSGTFSIDTNIERANFCTESSKFICFITDRYKFIFPKEFTGQKSWYWENYTFCLADGTSNSDDESSRLLVYIWEGSKCDEHYAGTYLYSKKDGLQYISTNIGLPVGQLDLLATKSKGFGSK